MTVLQIVGSIAFVLVIGLGANWLMGRKRRPGHQSHIDPMSPRVTSPYVQPNRKRIEEETKKKPPATGPG
jgi:hypothetical protein